MQTRGEYDVADTAVEKPSNGQAKDKDKVEEVKDQAQEKVQEASGQARDRMRDQVDQRSTQAGERVASAAQDARSVRDELRRQGKDQPARLADQAADRAERLGSYLQESDADRILRDVEELGRKQPWALVAGGLALGFMASRFLKASSQRRYASGGPV
jgi:vacuolar-type H+-ATPase subunit H